jgi:hypothetical protein
MKTLYKTIFLLAVGALWMGIGAPLRAAIIFNNSTNDLRTRFDPGTSEVGDEIILGGPERYLTSFSFEFWGTNGIDSGSFAGIVEARVRFYQNNGPLFHGYPSPGTNFYDSDWFQIFATPRSTENFSMGSDFPWTGLFLPVTSNMTWSVQFTGMRGSDTVGVDLYSPPVVGQGQDYPDYWLNIGGGLWELRTNNLGVHMDFGAVMEARAHGQPYLTNSVFGNFQYLLLSWDDDFLGWKLQAQTNAFGVGITTNWHTVPGTSVVTDWVLPIDKANGSVFCRLISP